MPVRTNGGVFSDQMLTGSLSHWVITGADFSGAIDQYGQPVPFSAAEIIFKNIEASAYINIMNPNKDNLSFALEEGRSTWTGESLQAMIRGLGTDVGADHLDLSNVKVEQVPYNFAGGTGGATSFSDLSDVPHSYSGAAGYIVTVNPGETGLIFTPPPASAVSNAFSFVEVPTQPTLTAVDEDTLTIIPGSNIIITTDEISNSLVVSAVIPDSSNYIAVPAGTALTINNRYFVTSPGIVTLPALSSANVPGQSVTITKLVGITVFVNIGNVSDEIHTDLGTTDSIEFDATEELIFVVSSENSWELQIGAVI